MSALTVVATLAAALVLVACAARSPGSSAEGGLPEQRGTIQKVGSFGFAIVPDQDPGTRYAPDKLPPELEVDGLKVLFAGVVTSPPTNVRMWGTPLKLTSIRRAP